MVEWDLVEFLWEQHGIYWDVQKIKGLDWKTMFKIQEQLKHGLTD